MPEAPLIIRGGHAVAPQEVERVLLAHPAVAEAAVVGVPDPLGDQIVAAAVRRTRSRPAGCLPRRCRAPRTVRSAGPS
jgi:acyl-coenzyme A synthetase/AMP-(fatty) acid ligase